MVTYEPVKLFHTAIGLVHLVFFSENPAEIELFFSPHRKLSALLSHFQDSPSLLFINVHKVFSETTRTLEVIKV